MPAMNTTVLAGTEQCVADVNTKKLQLNQASLTMHCDNSVGTWRTHYAQGITMLRTLVDMPRTHIAVPVIRWSADRENEEVD